MIDTEHGQNRISVASIYIPNRDTPVFLTIIEGLDSLDNDLKIMGGDFNLVIDLEKDQKGGTGQTNFRF